MPNNFETGASDNQDSNADNPWVRSMEEFGSDAQKVDVEDGLKKHQYMITSCRPKRISCKSLALTVRW